jgi:Predicted membrane-associated Zn-dependent proteases 1
MTIILAIVLLCILITVHEFGHFVAARLTGIPVAQFAIGMGPKILSWKSKKHDTVFSLRIIPVGGFCAFVGEDDVAEEFKGSADAFTNHAVWKRVITVLMGPVMNFVLAFVVAVCYFAFTPVTDISVHENSATIMDVSDTGAAKKAGVLVGDQITSVAGKAVDLNDPAALGLAINEAAAISPTVDIVALRGDEEHTLRITPVYSETQKTYLIGISIALKYTESEPYRLSFSGSIKRAADYCVDAATLVFRTLDMIIKNKASLNDFSGPVGVVTMISEQTQTYGADAYISMLIVISINLGIMNLLPIPGLDGSRILFMLLEAIRRKPIDQKKEAMVHLAGYLLLFGFMLLLTYKDIARLITGG